jgi:hypothetical protein
VRAARNWMTSVRADNIRGIVFTASCHKSVLPHFAGPMYREISSSRLNCELWQFAKDGVRMTSEKNKLYFYIATSQKCMYDELNHQISFGDPDPDKVRSGTFWYDPDL